MYWLFRWKKSLLQRQHKKPDYKCKSEKHLDILEKCSAVWWSSKGSVWSWLPFGEKKWIIRPVLARHGDGSIMICEWKMRKQKLCGKYWSNISRHLPGSEASAQMVLQNGQWAKNAATITKWLKVNKVHPFEEQSEDWGADRNRCFWAKEPKTLTQLGQFCEEEWAKITANDCQKVVDGYRKCWTPVIQFKKTVLQNIAEMYMILWNWKML